MTLVEEVSIVSTFREFEMETFSSTLRTHLSFFLAKLILESSTLDRVVFATLTQAGICKQPRILSFFAQGGYETRC